jgi:hypothetical protein
MYVSQSVGICVKGQEAIPSWGQDVTTLKITGSGGIHSSGVWTRASGSGSVQKFHGFATLIVTAFLRKNKKASLPEIPNMSPWRKVATVLPRPSRPNIRA